MTYPEVVTYCEPGRRSVCSHAGLPIHGDVSGGPLLAVSASRHGGLIEVDVMCDKRRADRTLQLCSVPLSVHASAGECGSVMQRVMVAGGACLSAMWEHM
jgi:hypothetical protein